jgi:F-type H+-transporting ATPase subunit f
MHASLVRRQLSGLVPPKIASPSILVSTPLPHFFFCFLYRLAFLLHQSTGKGADLSPLVGFYSKLPKGPASEPAVSGIKARYFNGKNASASPIVFTVLALFGLGYTLDYHSAWPLTVSLSNYID